MWMMRPRVLWRQRGAASDRSCACVRIMWATQLSADRDGRLGPELKTVLRHAPLRWMRFSRLRRRAGGPALWEMREVLKSAFWEPLEGVLGA